MTCLLSHVPRIAALRFEPLPRKPIKKVAAAIGIGNVVLIRAASGRLYTNAVQRNVAYSDARDGRLGVLLDACIRLDVLSPEAVREHKEACAAREAARAARYAAAAIERQCESLGIKLTPTQRKRVEAAKKDTK